ncbi:MAG: tRNA preQ1(34) S-adenosylmethionine ribosyltransferase-isomerase QueA [Gracilimonas sp.]|uniref:tRNA preQ1(34) S-adenosylmethionine ribosyltransferase-isomerase QueA n=1 Tax=Gracilimonas sp. TaxID=1974203 RepID=UPI001AFD9384|nr:tRNA preQ1(34) S-adenosylmethionine ribosyltransferase-isomerase QueA [Gracilimonas sp.]MBO6584743.1 tRNA preQ1(34) S-adenosylmethionine ribosyltransferase-isomerase QueA [Gracilimonas sp.]MBO6615986.1 tRNA preQ1(34) S-adenosylmethionine ribosyltransferase-isomerase QueA [Gracilimonas sp.]
MNFTLSDFDYNLPEELIAQSPAQPRDHARLLVYSREDKTITDDHFYNIGDYLPGDTTMVVNNSKVEKCRLLFDDGKKELFVTSVSNNNTIEAMVRPGKKFKQGKELQLTEDISAKVINIAEDGLRTLMLSCDMDDPKLEPYKHTPFPPYIEQDESLSDEYQTVYAKDLGSKAAPTAGLHFTDELLAKLKESGIKKTEVTLHVGLGTFAPVKTENLDQHNMHSEWFQLTESTCEELNAARHITAVGTTSIRVLETASNSEQEFTPESRETDIFITPGYSFKAVDALITNFHLPKSTLLMLVAAFMGFDEMKRVYEHAISEEYRFYSFGDAMLIL